jgi:hypothetical protein
LPCTRSNKSPTFTHAVFFDCDTFAHFLSTSVIPPNDH